jgi:DNA repair protein RecN (Recombination protein N)
MLTELRIRNFAVIDQLTVRLGPGLNVLTGETGAGKSIVVGALSLLLGERASADVVRSGADRASVEGVFQVEGRRDLLEWLDERGIDPGDGILNLRREVAAEGRSRGWINGSAATAGLLGELGSALVNLHGQHQHQTLLRRDEQRAILDAFGGHERLLAEVARAHETTSTLTAAIRSLEERRRLAVQRADYLRFQVDEIESAAVQPGEEARLAEEARRLTHAEELIGLTEAIRRAAGSGADSASERLGSARRTLEQLVRIDSSQADLSELFDTAYYALEELDSRLHSYLLLIEHDPQRLEVIRQRQDLLYRLRSKYGSTLDDVLRTLDEARRELALVGEAEWELDQLARRRAVAEAELAERAGTLSAVRDAAAETLALEVNRVLPELGMVTGCFEIARLPFDVSGAHGAEEIEFRVSLNRGFDPKPFAYVASGGELSRLMLALQTILARLDAVPTLIFDEVDAGIGGRVALHVGDKMREVARSHQVLAITHLPQIASRAHLHLFVRKDDREGVTTTSVTALDSDQRVREIARMLGGDADSAASLAHARELLDKGQGALVESAPA